MATGKQTGPWRWVFFALLGAGLLVLPWLLLQRDAGEPEVSSAATYRADKPLSLMPQLVLPGYVLLTPAQLVSVPEVDGFQWPCGVPDGAMMYDAQPFGTPNPEYGGQHLAMDINGIGGENSDEGEYVCAAARGLVVYSGCPSPGWGNVVVLAHRLPGTDRIIQSLYAHLGKRRAFTGQFVSRGDPIGTIGTAGGRYLAHLHFEMIESVCGEAGMRGYNPVSTANRLNPAELIAAWPAPAIPDLFGEQLQQCRNAAAAASPSSSSAPSGNGYIQVNPQQFISQ